MRPRIYWLCEIHGCRATRLEPRQKNVGQCQRIFLVPSDTSEILWFVGIPPIVCRMWPMYTPYTPSTRVDARRPRLHMCTPVYPRVRGHTADTRWYVGYWSTRVGLYIRMTMFHFFRGKTRGVVGMDVPMVKAQKSDGVVNMRVSSPTRIIFL
jgi:hypothetical protein